MHQVYLNRLSGPLPPITKDCPLCSLRWHDTYGWAAGLVLEPMRPNYGAIHIICGDVMYCRVRTGHIEE